MTRSFGFVVVTDPVQPVTPPWRFVVVPSRGTPAATPVKDAAAIRPCPRAAGNVAVRTVPDASPSGADAEAIATWSLFASLPWTSTVHVRPPPLTDVRARVASFQTT